MKFSTPGIPLYGLMLQQDTDGFTGVDRVLDSVHVKPSRKNKRGSIIPGRFDTVLFDNLTQENITGVIGLSSSSCAENHL